MYGNGQTPQGTDAFQFFLNSGVDRILDFQNDIDQLEVSSAYGFASPAVIATATVSGADVTLDFGGGNEVTPVGYGLPPNTRENDIVII